MIVTSGTSAGMSRTFEPSHGDVASLNVPFARGMSDRSSVRVGMYGAPSAPARSERAIVKLLWSRTVMRRGRPCSIARR